MMAEQAIERMEAKREVVVVVVVVVVVDYDHTHLASSRRQIRARFPLTLFSVYVRTYAWKSLLTSKSPPA